mmetsp:Transcript_41018/g.47314  ORF Transcript_41018/g.47314 Transcript_41018/m.47314 type:complete len:283 (+) Transcript_41018:145-993(+)
MNANNNNQESNSNNNSNTSTTMSLTGMTINSLGINKRDIDQISRIISDESLDNKNSKRRKLSVNITASQNHQFHHVRVPQGRIKRPLSPRSCPPVIKPCNYLMKLFQNKDLPNTTTTRIDSFSIEQALYFEPYQESAEIPTDILKALRTSNVGQLRSFLKEKKNSLKDCRNQFGENLLHLACRMGGISSNVIAFLVQEAKVPLNVRDRFGRTPLHHACMSFHPNFDTIAFVIRHIPRMCLLFEDDNGKIPFDLIPSRCEEGWTQFLSETKNILHNNHNHNQE